MVGDASRAGKALLTLLVDNLEDHVAELGNEALLREQLRRCQGFTEKR
ncbi:MAG: hypothetical protein ACYDER_22085 [Ktedonobacteraceae bacterium]